MNSSKNGCDYHISIKIISEFISNSRSKFRLTCCTVVHTFEGSSFYALIPIQLINSFSPQSHATSSLSCYNLDRYRLNHSFSIFLFTIMYIRYFFVFLAICFHQIIVLIHMASPSYIQAHMFHSDILPYHYSISLQNLQSIFSLCGLQIFGQ